MSFSLSFSPRWSYPLRAFLPSLITMLLLIVQLLPWSHSTDATTPSFALMSIFLFSLRAPRLCPPLFAFIIGGFCDLTELTPLGSQAIIFLGISIELARRPRLGTMPFLWLWVFFAGMCFAVNVALWLVELVIGGHIVPLGQAIECTAIAVVIFPPIARLILMPIEHLAKGGNDG